MCSQYQQSSAGPYTLYTNGWGWSYGTGSQCSQIDTYTSSSNTLGWSTTWQWANVSSGYGQYNVKSFTNVQSNQFQSKPLSQYKSIPTAWNWYYTGNDYIANVAYDTFLGTGPNTAQQFEVMVWIGYFGSDYPLSDSGYPPTPVAQPTIDGTPWNLIVGTNGNMKVYSFTAQNYLTTDYKGDLNSFFKYLQANQGLASSLYLQSVQAGTEVFHGTNMKLTTNSYSISFS
ncbi:MAG: hypothetical protein Q9160_004898 [Pyrenula sp. 1 TL-2023]